MTRLFLLLPLLFATAASQGPPPDSFDPVGKSVHEVVDFMGTDYVHSLERDGTERYLWARGAYFNFVAFSYGGRVVSTQAMYAPGGIVDPREFLDVRYDLLARTLGPPIESRDRGNRWFVWRAGEVVHSLTEFQNGVVAVGLSDTVFVESLSAR